MNGRCRAMGDAVTKPRRLAALEPWGAMVGSRCHRSTEHLDLGFSSATCILYDDGPSDRIELDLSDAEATL